METRSCEYNVQKFPEDEAHKCGQKGIKRATTFAGLDMVYCKKHFASAEERLREYKANVEDYE